MLSALATAASASAAPARATGSATALAVRVFLPGAERPEEFAAAKAPPARLVEAGTLQYGEGILTTGAVWSRARAAGGTRATAAAWSTVRTVSLFGDEITIGAISVRATAEAAPTRADGGARGSWLADVHVLGEPVRAGPNVRVPLADWGYVVLLEQAVVREGRSRVGRKSVVSGVHVHLTAEHAGLPAGTEIVVGYAEALATSPRPQVAPPAAPPAATSPPPPPAGVPLAPPKGPKRDPEPQPPGAPPKPPQSVLNPPADVRPILTPDRYVFPVYGPSSFTDDFAASRALTGWHHGNDIFAPTGAPILAATDGTLFLVGWNDVGGNRLWLRDDQGNEFYYAHLSAFSPLAYDGSRVQAGDVIGFVGATGDAVGTPPHLHFEVHPASLLGLGYDGVVNPYPYLLAWRRVADATFEWGTPKPGEAPPPGLVLLQADDIAATSGLDADGLAALMAMPALFGESLAPAEDSLVAGEPGAGRG